MPHFAWLPPEINSALLYAGAGAAPLLAAAEAWGGLAEDLASSAASFGSVTSDLVGNSWQGASSAAMMEVATQYLGWLSAAAVQADQAAGQATATATAFETALAATVQPAVVQANRALQQVLAATNWLGQNAPAIADIESAYDQMWAMDVAAMFGYHADASQAAAQLSPWEKVLETLGFHINSNGSITLGLPATSSGSSATMGTSTATSGTTTSSNTNLGLGNTGGNNIGFGNQGSGNIGFGNTGNNDFGIGLTGNNQFGFGGFNSGSGNVGFFNSGTGNVGFFNSGNGNFGIGNSGTQNLGFANSGSVNAGLFNSGYANTGLWQGTTAQGVLSNHYVTGSLGAANLSSGLLNSTATGGIGSSLGSPDALSPAISNAVASSSFSSQASASVAAGVSGNSGTVSPANGTAPAAGPRAGVTAPAGFFTATGGDPAFRNAATRDSGLPDAGFLNGGAREDITVPGPLEPLIPE